MVHLSPLPGSPRWAGSMATVIDRALADARALADNGFDALLLENFADVQGKHAVPLGAIDLEQHARDLVHRGLADALIVSGRATGEPTPLGDLKRVRDAVPGVAMLVGSGVTPETAAELLSVADALV